MWDSFFTIHIFAGCHTASTFLPTTQFAIYGLFISRHCWCMRSKPISFSIFSASFFMERLWYTLRRFDWEFITCTEALGRGGSGSAGDGLPIWEGPLQIYQGHQLSLFEPPPCTVFHSRQSNIWCREIYGPILFEELFLNWHPLSWSRFRFERFWLHGIGYKSVQVSGP